MDTRLMKQIKDILKEFPQYWMGEELQRPIVIDDLKSYDALLISALLKNQKIRENYSVKAGDVVIFKVQEFIDILRYKDYWADSYTKYSNNIGLSSEGKYLQYNTDVVLDFPYKDCVLEGGMTKEDAGKEEVFYNEVIARDEIDTLLAPKALVNAKKYDSDGEYKVDSFNDKDNLIIKGNNLLALHSLKERFSKKIKAVFIDPPYNTGGDSFKYNDRFNHSSWLTFMRNRLEVAKELLSEDGSLMMTIDYNELSYLTVLTDEIFGRENLQNIITVKRSSASGAKVINPGVVNVSDYLLIYSKNKSMWKPNRIFAPKERDKRYNQFITNYDSDKEDWKYIPLLDAFSDKLNIKKSRLKTELGDDYDNILNKFAYENADRIFRFVSLDDNQISKATKDLKYLSKQNSDRLYHMERDGYSDYYIMNGQAMLFMKDRLISVDGEMRFGSALTEIWDDVLPNDLHNEGGVSFKKGKKTEKLVSRAIELTTNTDDYVLDFFGGSGTTGAVALKLKRKFIIIEQMNYIESVTKTRMYKTVKGESTAGISKDVNWQGGGSFVYAELMELNQLYMDKIDQVSTKEELADLWNELDNNADLNFQLDKEKLVYELLKENDEEEGSITFNDLTFDEQKEIFKKALDKNQLYVPYSEIEDKNVIISDDDKAFNHSFYSNEGE
ncbi:TPA: site-specific DNA-methyltransferase [Enterococcus faecium]|nr:site-specific DNA-methyltransferase [Enterococcus faecium]